MAQAKLTVTRGRNRLQDVTLTPGTAIAGSDAIEVNIDYTRMRKGDALLMLEQVKQRIFASPWPLI